MRARVRGVAGMGLRWAILPRKWVEVEGGTRPGYLVAAVGYLLTRLYPYARAARTAHTHTVVWCVVVLINALCQCVCVCV